MRPRAHKGKMASMRPRAEDGNMATDESVAVLIKLPSVVRVSPSPVLRTGDAERYEVGRLMSKCGAHHCLLDLNIERLCPRVKGYDRGCP